MSNDWINSHRIAEDAKCGRLWLIVPSMLWPKKKWTNKQVEAQLHMCLKTLPIGKHRSVTHEEYKLLDKQIDRLEKVMDKMNKGLQGRQSQQKQTL